MTGWEPPRYDIGAGRHLPDPCNASTCLCGHTWDHAPTAEEWAEHRFGPDRQEDQVIQGLLLAAGAGSRMGTPKALVPGWLPGAVDVLLHGGCGGVTVVLGAQADRASALVPGGATVVVADDWERGMSASLGAGLTALADADVTAALVHLVDLPDVTADVVRRVLAAGTDATVLARASYDGRPGHPVLLGRDHWAGILAETAGDRGARAYLAVHHVTEVECGDLATGVDVDRR